jgi:hypothetical protein
MSFQWIINNAETISIERKSVAGSTISRDGTVRSVNRGGQVWQFTVKLPDGIAWTDYRQDITKTEKLDRFTAGNIAFSNTGHNWLIGYQGNSVNKTGFTANATQGSATLTLTASPTTSSGFKFRAGDIIQLGTTGKCYTVAADVAFNSNTVTLHRPVIDGSGGYNLQVAENCTWSVVCTEFPSWTMFSRDQISWNGAFVFYEVL